jgi:hypothetical protein
MSEYKAIDIRTYLHDHAIHQSEQNIARYRYGQVSKSASCGHGGLDRLQPGTPASDSDPSLVRFQVPPAGNFLIHSLLERAMQDMVALVWHYRSPSPDPKCSKIPESAGWQSKICLDVMGQLLRIFRRCKCTNSECELRNTFILILH